LVVIHDCSQQFFGYEKNAPAAEMLPAKESELAQALLTRWQARWQLHDHNSTARLPRQIIAASPSAIALASTVHKSFQSAADRHPLGLQFADIAPRFVFVLCHPVTYAFDKGFSALEDREGEARFLSLID